MSEFLPGKNRLRHAAALAGIAMSSSTLMDQCQSEENPHPVNSHGELDCSEGIKMSALPDQNEPFQLHEFTKDGEEFQVRLPSIGSTIATVHQPVPGGSKEIGTASPPSDSFTDDIYSDTIKLDEISVKVIWEREAESTEHMTTGAQVTCTTNPQSSMQIR